MSNSDDYDYSYSYSDDYYTGSGSYTEETETQTDDNKNKAADKNNKNSAVKSVSKDGQKKTTTKQSSPTGSYDDDESGSYSYYEEEEDEYYEEEEGDKANDDEESYSYSYSYDESDNKDDGSYSYSYDDTEDTSGRPPLAAAASGAKKKPDAKSKNAAPQKTTGTAGEESSYSYTGGTGDSYDEEGGSYSYTGDGNKGDGGSGSYYYSGSYSYDDYTGDSYDDYDDDYYSYSYSGDAHSGDSYYYSSYSGGYGDGSSYYYDDDYTDYDSYYYDDDSYSPYSGYTHSDSYYYSYSDDSYYYSGSSSGDKSEETSESVLVDGKSGSSTTSSYQYSSEATSSTSQSSADVLVDRDVLVLRTPSSDMPRVPPVPKRCLILSRSDEDAVHQFLMQLMALQASMEASGGRAVVAPLTAVEDSNHPKALTTLKQLKHSKSSKKQETEEEGANRYESLLAASSSLPTPAGHFSARSVSFALRTLGLSHVERREAVKGSPFPMPEETFAAILNTCVTARVREKVVQTFLSHDAPRRAEMPLTEVADILRRLGVARSPVVDGSLRVNVGCTARAKAAEMVMTIEVFDAASNTWEESSIPVCRIVKESMAEKKPTTLRWNKEAIYMGRHCICNRVKSEATFQKLKTYMEAATYVCVLVQLYAILDPANSQVSVQYPHLVRSLMTIEAPPPAAEADHKSPSPQRTRKSIYIENLYSNIYHASEKMARFAAGKGVPRNFAGKEPVEATLQATRDTADKRRRNVVPFTSADQTKLVSSPPRGPSDVQVCIALRKVRIPHAVPEGARCFCLVSAVTTDDVFLPAVEVPVRSVRVSSKEKGFTWGFADKKHHKDHDALIFVGPTTDKLYVECCYEVAEEEQGAATTWCAGYAVAPVAGLKTQTWPVMEGSLLDAAAADATAAVDSSSADPKEEKKAKKGGIFSCFAKKKKEAAATKATEVKVEVLPSNVKSLPRAEDMPSRYIMAQRHVDIMAVLRAAIIHAGAECSHAPQAMRRHVVQRACTVAADSALLDQLTVLWKHTLKTFKKKKGSDSDAKEVQVEKHEGVLTCATTLAALHNCTALDRDTFADLIIKSKPLPDIQDNDNDKEWAPQLPISI